MVDEIKTQEELKNYYISDRGCLEEDLDTHKEYQAGLKCLKKGKSLFIGRASSEDDGIGAAIYRAGGISRFITDKYEIIRDGD